MHFGVVTVPGQQEEEEEEEEEEEDSEDDALEDEDEEEDDWRDPSVPPGGFKHLKPHPRGGVQIVSTYKHLVYREQA